MILQYVAISASHAVEPNRVTPTPALATTIESTDTTAYDDADAKLSQLNLDTNDIADDTESLDLYLDVTLNGADKGIVHFYLRDDHLWASAAILEQLGFVIPSSSRDAVDLSRLPDLQVDYNARQQAVSLIAPLSLLNLDATVLDTRNNKRPLPTSSPGMLLNYNLYGTQTQNSAKSLSAYTELRAFNDKGVLSTTALTTANRSADTESHNGDWDQDFVRLDTSWSKSFPDKMITVRAGDILTGALSWTRATRLGGLQIGTNFDLQPYRSTTPLPSFFGSATLPSAVELYVNGLKQYSGNVSAGPFELNIAPSFSGVGNAQLVVTDALGQSTTLNFSLYDSHQLLEPGLSDWSLEVGAVRNNYGNRSFDYSEDIAASGTWRYGVNDRFSAETHAEITNSLVNAGLGGTWLLGRSGGILFASIATSNSRDKRGVQYSTNYSWNNHRFNVGLGAMGASDDYRDVGTQYGSVLARHSEYVSAGYNTESLGRFGFSYNQVSQAESQSGEFASAYWSKSFGQRLSVNASYNHDLNHSDNNSIALSASLSSARNISLNSSVQYTDDTTILATDISRSAPSDGGIGWRAQAQHRPSGSANIDSNISGIAEMSYLGRYGQARAGLSVNDSGHSSYASVSGAVVKMGGGLFAARQINNGFAVVTTGGIADLPVLLQNSPIGRTNSRGLLLVSPLNAYQDNKIGIDTLGLPADLRINKVSMVATPTDRAGTLVNFDITPVRAASVILIDSDRQPLPLGSQVRKINNKKLSSTVIGFDGEVYLDTLSKKNLLEVATPFGDVCTVRFNYSKQDDAIPLLGPFICDKV